MSQDTPRPRTSNCMAANTRARSAPPTPEPATSQALVLYNNEATAATCIGCGKTSDQVMWGQYKVTYTPDRTQILQRTPLTQGCSDCRDLAYLAHLPAKKSWDELVRELIAIRS